MWFLGRHYSYAYRRCWVLISACNPFSCFFPQPQGFSSRISVDQCSIEYFGSCLEFSVPLLPPPLLYSVLSALAAFLSPHFQLRLLNSENLSGSTWLPSPVSEPVSSLTFITWASLVLTALSSPGRDHSPSVPGGQYLEHCCLVYLVHFIFIVSGRMIHLLLFSILAGGTSPVEKFWNCNDWFQRKQHSSFQVANTAQLSGQWPRNKPKENPCLGPTDAEGSVRACSLSLYVQEDVALTHRPPLVLRRLGQRSLSIYLFLFILLLGCTRS